MTFESGYEHEGGGKYCVCFVFQAEDGIRDLVRSRGLGDVYKRQILNTMRYYLPEDAQVPENKFEVIPLSTDHIGFIISQSNYKQFLTPAYVEERISKSISAAIMKKDKLVAWGLTHDDGALGSLHVLDEYRKKGYGKEILISLIHQNRKLDKMSFAQIEEKNLKATNLVERLGFVKDRRVSWVKLS